MHVHHKAREGQIKWCFFLLSLAVVFSFLFAVVSQLLFSEIVFDVLLRLLNKEVSDHSRHLQQYFQVFLAYAHKGPLEVSYTVVYVYVLCMYV